MCLDDLERMSNAALCRRCREQTARFRRREPYDDRYCFAMFRRAIADGDQRCWDAMTEIYGDQVVAWCRRSGGDAGALDDLVADTWARFWQNYSVDKLNAAGRSTAPVLAYLKLCARSVVLDEARRRERNVPYEPGTFDDPGEGTASPESVESGDQPAFWSLIEEHLKDERERVLVVLSYELDLTPADIHRRRPDLFPKVQDVYKGRRNILDRLSRSRSLARWLAVPD